MFWGVPDKVALVFHEPSSTDMTWKYFWCKDCEVRWRGEFKPALVYYSPCWVCGAPTSTAP